MLPIPWPLVRRLWPVAAGAVLLAAILWGIHSYGNKREAAGRAAVQALWQADTAKRDETDRLAREQAAADIARALANNVKVTEDANQALRAIAADRDSLADRLRAYQNGLRALSARQATDQRGLDVAAGIASRAAEADRLYDAYDHACRNDAVRFKALQDELRPQL